MLQTWTHVLSCFDQRFQSQRCQRVLLALIRLSSPGHLTLTSWKRVMLLRMFWNTLVACIPPRSGLRQLTLSTSQYVRSVPSAPPQADALYLSYCFLTLPNIGQEPTQSYACASSWLLENLLWRRCGMLA